MLSRWVCVVRNSTGLQGLIYTHAYIHTRGCIYINARNDTMKYIVLGIYELAPSRMSSYTNMMLHGFVGNMELC
jgi:hypothetical protein